MDEEAHGPLLVLKLPEELSRLLGDPHRVGLTGATRHIHAPRIQLDEKKHVDRFQKDGFDGEKVAGEHLGLVAVVAEKLIRVIEEPQGKRVKCLSHSASTERPS